MDIFLNSSLFWFLLGIVFLLVEITHYGFVFFFFGIGAIIVAILTWFGLTNSINIQLIVFICSSLSSLFIFRNKLSHIFKGKVSRKLTHGQSLDDIKGDRAVVVSSIKPNELDGKVEFHGTIWQAQSDVIIEKGTVVEIIERNNLILKVRALK